MHKLLERQLRQHFGAVENLPTECRAFAAAVETAYRQSDEDRAQLELSMDTVSVELGDRFQRLREALATSQVAKEEQSHALSVLSAALESTTDGILIVDRDGHMVHMNQKFIELWNIPREIESAADDAAALAYVMEQLADPITFLAKVRELYALPLAESFDVLHFKDGRVVERYSRPQRIADETVGRVWSFRDTTERGQLEAQLRQSQKMEAIGALAGGVAHDFNNLLTVMRGHAELLRDSTVLSPLDATDVDEIIVAADRAAVLTRQLLAFSRRQVLKPVPLDLNSVVASVIPMLRRLIGENVVIAINGRVGLGIVVADPGQFEQVLMNLVVNARDAMPNGGRIEIATENITVEAFAPQAETEMLEPGSYVRLSVSDTGVGMVPDVQERIFEPFFSTKAVGLGTGLGLSTVFGIVKQSEGHISVKSEVGVGTVFTIHLHRAAQSALTPRSVARIVASAGGRETILMVEDDSRVRALVHRILTTLGYSVLVAKDADDAVSISTSHATQIDLLLTDVIMPGMSGPSLVEVLRARRPDLRTIYMSGYTSDEMTRGGICAEDVLLEKPFSRERLAAAIRESLD